MLRSVGAMWFLQQFCFFNLDFMIAYNQTKFIVRSYHMSTNNEIMSPPPHFYRGCAVVL